MFEVQGSRLARGFPMVKISLRSRFRRLIPLQASIFAARTAPATTGAKLRLTVGTAHHRAMLATA